MPTVFQLLKSILVTSIQTTSVPLIIHIKTVLMLHSYWRKLFAWLFACLDCQCSLSTVFSPRPSSTDTIPPHDKPTMLNLQTLSDWNFPLQMLRASITSWSGNTKMTGECVPTAVCHGQLTKGSSAQHRAVTVQGQGQEQQRRASLNTD